MAMMKSRRLIFSILFYAAVCSASDGRIDFSADLVPQTCLINAGVADIHIYLPSIPAADLNESVSGKNVFSISLSDCLDKTGFVHAVFSTPQQLNKDGAIIPEGSAIDVLLQLTNADGTPVAIGSAHSETIAQQALISDGIAILSYAVGYSRASTMPQAGTVRAVIDYTLVYE